MTIGSDETVREPVPAETTAERHRRKPRSRSARNSFVAFLSFCVSGALALALAAAGVVYWGKTEFEGAGPLQQEATYLVPKGGGLDTIASGLERKGIISDARIFEYGVRFERAASQLKAGEYAFAPGASMRDVMDTIRSGNAILHSVTIPEGWTVAQIYARLAADDTLVGDLPPVAPEGSLLPETYKFTRGLSRAELVSQMSAAQSKLVAEIWKGRQDGLPVKDIGQFVTLASIVEKETGIDSERPHVASVFVNRLRKNMRLQSDPTIIYGIWGGAGKPSDEPIRHPISPATRLTTPISSVVCRPARSPIPAARRWRRSPIRWTRTIFISSPTARVVMRFRRRWMSTMAMCVACARSSDALALYPRALRRNDRFQSRRSRSPDRELTNARPKHDGLCPFRRPCGRRGFRLGAALGQRERAGIAASAAARFRAYRSGCAPNSVQRLIARQFADFAVAGSTGECSSAFSINQTFLNEILRLSDELVRAGHATSPSADGLLALRGVIEVTDEAHQPEWFEARGPSVLEGLKAAVAALVAAREQEGEALRTLLVARLNEMEALVGQALEDPSRAPEALAARLRQQVMDLLGADALLDTARLHQEAAVMATKIDIREEIDRLTTHIAAARGLLADGGAIGRKLDFLSQEFNRESNTICSKSHAASLTAIGLQLKVVIDQFREQVQNIE